MAPKENKPDDDESLFSDETEAPIPSLVVPPSIKHLTGIEKLLIHDLASQDEKVVKDALNALADYCFKVGDDEHHEKLKQTREKILTLGGGSLVLAVVKKWYNYLSIQQNGFRAIQNMLVGATSDTAASNLVSLGTLEIVVQGMRNFPDDVYLQKNAVGALQNLTWDSKEDEWKHFVTELEGIQLVVRAMKAFPGCANLQHVASNLLHRASKFDEMREIIREEGGLVALATALEKHGDSQKVQKRAKDALYSIIG